MLKYDKFLSAAYCFIMLFIAIFTNTFSIPTEMQILFFTDDIPQGGAERQMVNLASSLTDNGHRVRFLQFYDHPCFYESILREKNIEVSTLHYGRNPLLRPFVVWWYLRNSGADAVLSFKEGAAMALAIVSPFIRPTVIVSERNHTPRMKWRDRFRLTLFHLADAVVCNSSAQYSVVKSLFPLLKARLHLITNSISGSSIPSRRRATVKVGRIVCPGRIVPQKNPEGMLQAFSILHKKYPDIALEFRGRYESESYFSTLKSKVISLGLDGFVSFLPPAGDYSVLYPEDAILCLPSHHEGFSNVLCEAMSVGILCCASSAGDNPDILGKKEFIFNPGSAQEIADTIDYILNLNSGEKAKISAFNHSRISELCNPDIMTTKYINLIRGNAL